tara:strand:+ start:17371 stop:18309 length:939 start_codon:yes stop_codon:yes gene_type:complete
MKIKFHKFIATLLLIIYNSISQATPITNLIVFGDSLSDSGNLFIAAGQPAHPYYQGKFTNGSNYAENLNQYLALAPLTPSLAGGNNYAWAGARAGMDVPMGNNFIPNVESQANQYLTSLAPNADLSQTLHLFFIGGNDIADAIDYGMDATTATGFLQNSAQNVVNAIIALDNISSTQFLLPTVPDLSITPRFLNQQIAQDYTNIYNQILNNLVQSQLPNLDILLFDTSNFINDITDDFSNSTSACLTQNSLCSNPDEYLFFDDFHPSRVTHQLVAEKLFATVDIPPTWILMLLMGVGLLRNNYCQRKNKSTP